jgi:membrane protein DedA with SNARE-associated domain
MNAAELVRHYGYYAVIVGTFFEGELIMLAAGVAACAGMLSLSGVIAAGMVGIFASDTVCFLIGRLAGRRIERWFPNLHARIGRIFRMIERHDEKLVVYFQFFPGLCTITPMAFGMSRISTLRFMMLDLIGNALWTLLFAFGGYAFGAAFARFVDDAHDWVWLAAAALIVAYSTWNVARLWLKRRA